MQMQGKVKKIIVLINQKGHILKAILQHFWANFKVGGGISWKFVLLGS